MRYIKGISPQQVHHMRGIDREGWYQDMDRCWMDIDDRLDICSRLISTPIGKIEHVSITKGIESKDPYVTWKQRMDVKNDIFGSGKYAIEIYPKSKNLVDISDVYHIWVFEKGIKDIFGIKLKKLGSPIETLTEKDREITLVSESGILSATKGVIDAGKYGKVTHLICQTDGENIPWATKWDIKNSVFGEDCVAIEILPASSSNLDTDKYFHLFAFEESFDMPFGIHPDEYSLSKVIKRGYNFTAEDAKILNNYFEGT